MKSKQGRWGLVLFLLVSLPAVDLRAQPQKDVAAPAGTEQRSVGPPPQIKRQVVESYGRLPLSFEANLGQTDPRVKFLSRGQGYTLFLTPTDAVLALEKPYSPKVRSKLSPFEKLAEAAATDDVAPAVVRMKLVGARPYPEISGIEELPGRTNYFIGNDPLQWRTDVASYAKVQYKGVYRDVDVVYHGNQRQLEYDFVVAPGADPRAIALAVEGADKLELTAEGDLVLHTRGGSLRLQKPLIYQQAGGTRQEISGGFLLQSKRRVGFQVGPYDPGKPLIIDPVLSYSTYLGGKGDENSSTITGLVTGGIAVDSAGNAYVAGDTLSSDFPTTSTPFQKCSAGMPPLPCGPSSPKVFISKLSPDGKILLYSTYLGGNGADILGTAGLGGIAVDSTGSAYVTGSTTSDNFPTTAGAFKTTFGPVICGVAPSTFPCEHAFVTKLAASGSSLVFSTFLGGSGTDQGADLKVDSSGSIYVTGGTVSTDFPKTTGAFQTTLRGVGNAFVTKLNPAGTGLLYSTFLGGSDGESGFRIAVDPSGNAYVTGTTSSRDFPTTPGSFQQFATSGGVFKTTTGGTSWGPSNGPPLETSLTHLVVLSLAAVAVTPPPPLPPTPTTTLYAGTGGGGVFRSTNGGGNWAAINTGLAGTNIGALAIDPKTPTTLYAGAVGGAGVSRSTNGGNNWIAVNTGLTNTRIRALAIDPITPTTIYAGTAGGVFKTANGGTDWSAASTGLPAGNVFALAIDPTAPRTLYAGTRAGVFKTIDGGTNWLPVNNGLPSINIRALAIDPKAPATVYAGTFGGGAGVFKTENGGTSWLPVDTGLPPINIRALAFDPATTGAAGTLYAGANHGGVFKTEDGGKSWKEVNTGVARTIRAFAIDPNTHTTVYAGTVLFDAFVTKLNAQGTALTYSTFLGGLGADFPSGIAVDALGNAYVTGTTISPDFPTTAGVLQTKLGGGFDAFVTKLNSTGTGPLVYSTYLGGSGNDSGNDITVDASGNAYLAGSTNSLDFPVANPFRAALSTQSNCSGLPGAQVLCSDAFVAKLNPTGTAPLLFSTYLGGDQQDEALGIARDAQGNVYISGYTLSDNFPTVNALQPKLGGGADAFVLKISDPSPAVLADLAFTAHSHSPLQVRVGETLTFMADVKNNGPSPATGVTMYVTGPGSGADVALVSATPTQGSCLPGGAQSKLFCTLGTLASGASVRVTIATTPITAGTFVGTLAVGGNESDPFPTNNTATETVQILPSTVAACTKTYVPISIATWETAGNWTPPGVPVPADVACISAFSTVTLSSAQSIRALNNSGTLNITSGSLTLAAESASNITTLSGGTLTTNALLTLSGTFTLSGGTLTGTGTVTANGAFNWTAGTMSGSGVTNANGLTAISGTATLDTRTVNNAGSATWSGTNNINFFNAVLNNQAGAIFNVNNDQSMFSEFGTETFNNAGVFAKVAGALTRSTNVGVKFNNTGIVNASSGTLNFSRDYTQTTAGSATVLSGGGISITSVAPMNIQGGRLAGIGTITGNVSNTGGTVAPGLAPATAGILTISSAGSLQGNYTQGADGALNVKIGGLTPGTQFDQLKLTSTLGGVATLAGTLNVSLISGFTPSAGNSFTIMAFTSRAGPGLTLGTVPTLPPGLTWRLDHNPTSVVLSVQQAGPTPSIVSVSPNSGQQGQILLVAISGQNTHFVQGTTVASFGAGITVNGAVTVSSATSATANLTIAADAATGGRTVTVTTGAEAASSAANAFLVAPLLDKTVTGVNATASVTQNATLDTGFLLSGTISGPTGSVPDSVEAISTTAPFGAFHGDVDRTTRAYRIVLPAGTYNLDVCFDRTEGLRVTSFTFRDLTPVTVSADTARNITLPAVATFKVSGTVSNLNMLFPFRSLNFDSDSVPGFFSVTTTAVLDADGKYEVQLPNGTYSVDLNQASFTSALDRFSDLSTVLGTATVSGLTTLNFAVPAITTARLSGTVSITSSPTIPGGSSLFALDNSGPPTPATISTSFTTLPPAGAYEFRLATGRKYATSAFIPVQLLPSPAPLGFFFAQDPAPLPDPLTADTVRNITLPALPGAATAVTISGRVTITGTTTPVANVLVGASFSQLIGVAPNFLSFTRETTTNANGDYSLGVPTGTNYTLSFQPTPRLPSIISLSPSSAPAGGDSFLLTVHGTNFVGQPLGESGSKVNFGGLALATTFVSPTELRAVVPKEAIAAAGIRAVTVTNPAPGGRTSNAVNFTVTPAAAPAVTLAPSSLDFGNQVVSTTSALRTVTLSNTGGASLGITSITVAGADATQFALSDTATPCRGDSSLAAGASCTFNVRFTPGTVGAKTANIRVVTNARTSPDLVPLSGTGVPAGPVVTLSSKSLDFASQPVGSSSTAQTVTLTNTSPGLGLSIASIVASGDFAQTNNCGSALAGSASCTITIVFTPTATGARNGNITLTDNAADSPQVVSLAGIGINAPAISLSATSLIFGSRLVGSTSPPQTITMTNSGNATLNITSIAASGDFAQTNNCGTSVAPSSSCTISATFAPTAGGLRTGGVAINSDARGSIPVVTLSGVGISSGVALSTTLVIFESQTVNTTSPAQSVTLTNASAATLTISSIVAGGDFAQTNTCGTSVAASSSCTISVTFTPTAVGARTGSITITDSGSGSPRVITLSGTGSIITLALSATSLSFGDQTVGTVSQPKTVTVKNTGGVTLAITSIAVAGDYMRQPDSCGTSLAAGATCKINVSFFPTVTGTRTGMITVASNAMGSPHMVSLTGTGAALGPAIKLSSASLTFPAQVVGTPSAAQVVTLTNVGNATLNITSIVSSSDFAQTNTCGTSVAAKAACTISVTFTPSATGTRAGAVTLTDNAGDSPQLIRLIGTGTPSGPALNLSASNVAFVDQVVGTTSAAQVVTLTNSGNATLTISRIDRSGEFAMAPGTTCTNGLAIATAASCSIHIGFAPTVTGARAGAITITDNGPGSPHTITLAGNGTDFSISVPPGSPTSATITAGQAVTFTMTLTPAGGFNGDVTVSCSGKPPAGTCTTTPNSFLLSAPTTITTTVTTTAPSRGNAWPSPQSWPPLGLMLARLPRLLWLLALAMLCSLAAVRRRHAWLGAGACLFLVLLISGCAGGAGSPGTVGQTAGTPPNTYMVTVTAVSTPSGASRSMTLTVTVHP